MRRVIGKLLVVGLLSSGVALAAAGPSSALPRDPCMDEINWWEHMSWLTQEAEHAWDVYSAWENATVEHDPVANQNNYTARIDGENVVLPTSEGYQHQLSVTYAAWTVASDDAIYFYNSVPMC